MSYHETEERRAPTPWQVAKSRADILDANGTHLAECFYADHIVRCVNAHDRLTAALIECLEYFEERYDVNDGDYGVPEANKEMQMGTMIEWALGRKP